MMGTLLVKAPVAQWLEQGTHNSLVLGSSPGGSTFALSQYLLHHAAMHIGEAVVATLEFKG